MIHSSPKSYHPARLRRVLSAPLLLGLLVLAAAPPWPLTAQSSAADGTTPAAALLDEALEAAGGFDTWASKKSVAFRKSTRRFDETGTLESERVEVHTYRLHPLGIRMDWVEGEQRLALVNDGSRAVKLVNDSPATTQADRDQAWNATFGSHYMFSLPFKLTDDGAILTPAPPRPVGGTPADGLQVDYEPGAGSTGGMMTWTYYFDDSRDLVAYFLRFGDGDEDYRWTEYFDVAEVAGLRFPTRRKVYRSNAAGERLELLSEISHEDIRFDVELEDDLFRVSD